MGSILRAVREAGAGTAGLHRSGPRRERAERPGLFPVPFPVPLPVPFPVPFLVPFPVPFPVPLPGPARRRPLPRCRRRLNLVPPAPPSARAAGEGSGLRPGSGGGGGARCRGLSVCPARGLPAERPLPRPSARARSPGRAGRWCRARPHGSAAASEPRPARGLSPAADAGKEGTGAALRARPGGGWGRLEAAPGLGGAGEAPGEPPGSLGPWQGHRCAAPRASGWARGGFTRLRGCSLGLSLLFKFKKKILWERSSA